MSNLSTFSVLNEKVQKIHNDEQTPNLGTAFIMLGLQTLFKLTEEELEEAITDGPDDGEIDAIYISERVIHILTFKYTANFNHTKKNFPGTDIDQFAFTIDQIISGNLAKNTVNHAVWDKYQEIRLLATSGKVDFKVYAVSNKLYPNETSQNKLKAIIEKFKRIDDPIYVNQEDLVSKIIGDKVEKVHGNLKFIEKQHFEKSDGNVRTVIGAVAAQDLIDLVKLNDDLLNENSFNENVRVYKPKHRVNQAIIESALDKNNYEFFYLNNGITILCEEVEYTPNTRSPLVELKNYQIINGGQTTHSLFEAYKKNSEQIKTIDILIRICEAKSDNPISDKISETSNNQIPVGSRDLHSNDNIQKKLEEEFNTLGYYYERKPNQHADKPKDKVLNNELLGQLFMAYHLDMPSEAKNNKSKVFNDMYDQIFDGKVVTGKELFRLYNIYLPLFQRKKEIQRKKRKKENISEREAFISRAIFHIINTVKLLYENEEKKIDKKNISEAEKRKKKEELFPEKDSKLIKKAIKLIYEKVEEEMDARGELYTHDKFFKELGTNRTIRLSVLNKLNKNSKKK